MIEVVLFIGGTVVFSRNIGFCWALGTNTAFQINLPMINILKNTRVYMGLNLYQYS